MKTTPDADGHTEQPTANPREYTPPSIAPQEADDDAPSLQLEYHKPPIERLPYPVADYVAKSAEAIGCDPSMVALPTLAAIAAAIGDSRAVEVKPGWIELPILWTLVIAPSGAHKTPAIKAAMDGIDEEQRKAFERWNKSDAQYQEALARYTAKKEGPQPQPPELETYWISDATIEAVQARLATNPRGLLQKRDELSGWLGSFDRYSNGNECPQWLEFHSGNAVRTDRKGDRPLYVPRGLVSVTGTIQAPVLQKQLSGTGDDAENYNNGLAARFLMAMPIEQLRCWREETVPPQFVKLFRDLFASLLSLRPHIDQDTGRREPILMRWSEQAKGMFIAFVNKNGREMRAFRDDRLKSAWSKLEGQAARLALVFHCTRQAFLPSPETDGNRISAETLADALAWIEWLKHETRRIYFTLRHAAPQQKQADRLLAFARRNGGRCTPRDAHRNRAGGSTVEDVSSLMASLVAAGLAHWEEPEHPTGGRPTKHFCLSTAPAP